MRKDLWGAIIVALSALGTTIGGLALGNDGPVASTSKREAPILAREYGTLPLGFHPNVGQTDRQVKFLAHGKNISVFLTGTKAVIQLRREDGQLISRDNQNRPTRRTTIIRTDLIGANSNSLSTGEGELPGKINYFIGNDPKRWRTGVASFGRVRFTNVYPGINLIYYGNQRQLEYDFVVLPGANPGVVRLAVAGAEKISQDSNGNLVVHAGQTDLVQHAPIAYQNINGMRHRIRSRFALKGTQVAFQLGKYDHRRTLIIDPVLSYSTYIGGSGVDIPEWSTLDKNRNLYIAGFTSSIDFPTSAGTFQGSHAGGTWDAFVAKLNSTGSALVYSTYIGGSGDDFATGISVTQNGGAVFCGITTSSNFPTKSAVQNNFAGGPTDAFVTALDPTGAHLIYSTYLGGSGDDQAWICPIQPDGTVSAIGLTSSGNFPTTLGAFQTSNAGNYDAFVTKLDPTGQQMLFSTYVGASGDDRAFDGTVDSNGNVVFTGRTSSTDFPTTPGVFQPRYGGGDSDAFIAKLKADGSALIFSTFVGGSGHETVRDLKLDSDGNAYLPGATSSTDFPTTPGAFQTTYAGGIHDGFLTVVNSRGAGIYSTLLGGSGDDTLGGVVVESVGHPFIVGVTGSHDFPVTQNALQANFGGGNYDAFVARLDLKHSKLLYSSFFGGTGDDEDSGQGVSLDDADNLYFTGDTTSSDLPTSAHAFQPTFGGTVDGFAAKISF